MRFISLSVIDLDPSGSKTPKSFAACALVRPSLAWPLQNSASSSVPELSLSISRKYDISTCALPTIRSSSARGTCACWRAPSAEFGASSTPAPAFRSTSAGLGGDCGDAPFDDAPAPPVVASAKTTCRAGAVRVAASLFAARSAGAGLASTSTATSPGAGASAATDIDDSTDEADPADRPDADLTRTGARAARSASRRASSGRKCAVGVAVPSASVNSAVFLPPPDAAASVISRHSRTSRSIRATSSIIELAFVNTFACSSTITTKLTTTMIASIRLRQSCRYLQPSAKSLSTSSSMKTDRKAASTAWNAATTSASALSPIEMPTNNTTA